jgi:hypothetical protein
MNMRSLRVIAPLAIGAVLTGLAVAPTMGAPESSSAEPIVAQRVPVAHAAGGDAAPPPLPSIVNVRVERAEAALERAAAAVDQGQPSQANAELTSVRSNMAKAWTAAHYIIATTPPPPPAEEGRVRADASGGAVVGAVASPEETALGVLNLHHDVVTAAVGLADTTDPTLGASVQTTINAALKARNRAIAYIHSIAPPPVADEGRVQADASGAEVGTGFDALMPGYAPLLDDEIQQATVARLMAPSSPVGLGKVARAETNTRNTINTYWPPVLPED